MTELYNRIYAYLGFASVDKTAKTDKIIESCLKELKGLAHFRYTYKIFDAAPEFVQKEPYISYLKGSSGVILGVMTLGAEVDNRIKLLSRTDAARAVVLDAVASAYLEELSDEYEKGIGDGLSYRFCPGYGGSELSDIRHIFALVKPEKIGVTLTSSDYMLPSKSMAGIIAVGGRAQKTCKNCIVARHCGYLERGERCYGSDKR